MTPVDIEYNNQVRQQFAADCALLSNRIIALQTRNEQISLKLRWLIEKGKALHGKWLVRLVNIYPTQR